MATNGRITHRTDYEKWQDDIDGADEKWDSYDTIIQSTVNQYNTHLTRTTSGYYPLDWKLVKAMVWTETGASNPQWARNPMQIGVRSDPGLLVMQRGEEGSDLIVPPMMNSSFAMAARDPRANIEAGVGYLLTRMANTAIRTVPEPGSQVYDVTVKAGDSLSKIAKAEGSTEEMMKQLNPDVRTLAIGQVLKCQKASLRRVVTGWKFINTSSIAIYYNGGGDPKYQQKLDYAIKAMGRAP